MSDRAEQVRELALQAERSFAAGRRSAFAEVAEVCGAELLDYAARSLSDNLCDAAFCDTKRKLEALAALLRRETEGQR